HEHIDIVSPAWSAEPSRRDAAHQRVVHLAALERRENFPEDLLERPVLGAAQVFLYLRIPARQVLEGNADGVLAFHLSYLDEQSCKPRAGRVLQETVQQLNRSAVPWVSGREECG